MASPTTPKPRSTPTKPTGKAATATPPAVKPESSVEADPAPPVKARAPRKAPAAKAAASATPKPTAPRKPSAPRKAAPPKPAPLKSTTAPAVLGVVSARTAWSIGALLFAAGAGITAFLARGRIGELLAATPSEGHVPTDLLDPNRNADDRAVADFRPNIDAPMTDAEREALRPATIPTLVANG